MDRDNERDHKINIYQQEEKPITKIKMAMENLKEKSTEMKAETMIEIVKKKTTEIMI